MLVQREEGFEVKLADFEYAVPCGDARAHGAGTPHYMSPESLELTQRSTHDFRPGDIWSLAVTLFHLVSGRYPFTSGSVLDTADARSVKEQTRRRIYRHWNGGLDIFEGIEFSPSLQNFLQQCFHSDEEQRIKTVEGIFRHEWMQEYWTDLAESLAFALSEDQLSYLQVHGFHDIV